MNRDQKAQAIADIAGELREAQAVFAVDPSGLSVKESGEIRTKLRDADTRLAVVKNTLGTRAADEAGTESIKALLSGPTALAFVRGDAAAAAKALSDYAKATDKLPFKGGLLDGNPVDVAEIQAIAKLPSREVLYGQLVGVVASPITGLARGLNGLVSGLAIALGGVLEKKESGELPSGEAPAAPPASDEPAAEASADDVPTEAAVEPTDADQDAEAPDQPATPEAPAEGADDASATTSNDEE